MQVKERTFSVLNMIFFTFNSQQYFKYFDFLLLPHAKIFTLVETPRHNKRKTPEPPSQFQGLSYPWGAGGGGGGGESSFSKWRAIKEKKGDDFKMTKTHWWLNKKSCDWAN